MESSQPLSSKKKREPNAWIQATMDARAQYTGVDTSLKQGNTCFMSTKNTKGSPLYNLSMELYQSRKQQQHQRIRETLNPKGGPSRQKASAATTSSHHRAAAAAAAHETKVSVPPASASTHR